MKKGEASATWTSLVKIHYDGVDYDTGMVIGAELKNGKVTTQIGFSAQTFIVYNPANGKMEPVFAIKNGQVIFNSAFIGEGTITNAIIKSDIRSPNYDPIAKTGMQINFARGTLEFYGHVSGKGSITQDNNRLVARDNNNVVRAVFGYLEGI